MSWNRADFGRTMVMLGSGVLALGILLLIVKLVVFVAWYAAGAIALAGLIMLIIGMLSRPGQGG